jgi:hypothetical protein
MVAILTRETPSVTLYDDSIGTYGDLGIRNDYALFEQMRVIRIPHRFISMIRIIDALPFVIKC